MLGDIQQEVAQADNTPAPAEAVNAPVALGQDTDQRRAAIRRSCSVDNKP